MGAVPSRESTSLFSYFRGSYEVGMVPLTKFYFGRDSGTEPTSAAAAGAPPGGGSSSKHATSASVARARLRHQLRQQLLLMRRDPAVLYANAREVDNILDSILQRDSDKDGSASEMKSKSSNVSSPTTTNRSAGQPPRSPASPCESDKRASAGATPTTRAAAAGADAATAAAGAERDETTVRPDGDELKVLGHDIQSAFRDEVLRRDYWSVMPNDNFSESDLDHFLELVEETLFDTNEELLAADPLRDVGGGESAQPAAGEPHRARRPFLPVPCALCLAYPDGKERDGAFSLDGRVVNIIGYFGLMTPAMQDAFKVVKRLPTEVETAQTEQLKKATDANGDTMPTMYLNTAILTSAGDRTLERVLVLAAVMLRQQFHTIGRRHLLQEKMEELVRKQLEQQPDADPQMLHYLQNILAIPHTTNGVLGTYSVNDDGVHLPFFDPLLEVPLPSIPRGIYKPTHYINAASADPPRRPASMNSIGRASFNGSAADNSLTAGCGGYGTSPSHLRSLPQDTQSAAAAAATGGRLLLYPQSGSLMNNGPATPSAIVVPGSVPGSAASPPLLMPGSMANSQGSPSTSYGSNMPQHPSGPAALPLEQSDEDAITLAFCRRMEKLNVLIETASNNYSALKSLTENFAFLHCQIVLDESLTQMELIDLPGLAETPSFKPLLSATTAVTTLRADASGEVADMAERIRSPENGGEGNTNKESPTTAAGASGATGKSLARYPLSPNSAVVIKLNPLLVRQAAMWASSFFHCPTRLPTGSWVKYKLKDECDQLRHVLQNKDMLIAHWRKTDADRASRYLGIHTGRLLEHVRALQAETEEARALPAEHWSHRPLFVNQDGRKYALFQSRYGTMLIGVRAFASGGNGSTTSHPAERTAAGAAAAGGGGAGGHSTTSNANNSGGNLSGHSGSLNHNASSAHAAHSAGKADSTHGHNTGQNLRGGHNASGGGIAGGSANARLYGSQANHPFYMSNSGMGGGGNGPYMPYMAPPPEMQMGSGGSMGTYYASPYPTMMVPHGSYHGSSSGGPMSGPDAPAYYAHAQMMSMGSGSSYGSKHSMPMAYMHPSQPSSLNGMPPPHMMYRGGPPPPPPPMPPQHPPQAASYSSVGSAGGNHSGAAYSHAAMMSAGVPQYYDPGHPMMLSASVHHMHATATPPSAAATGGADAATTSSSTTANVLHLNPQSRTFTSNNAPPFLASPPSATNNANTAASLTSVPQLGETTTAATTTTTMATTSAAATATAAEGATLMSPHAALWQSTHPSSLPSSTAAAFAGATAAGVDALRGGVDRNGNPLHITGAAPVHPASLLSPGVPAVSAQLLSGTVNAGAVPAAVAAHHSPDGHDLASRSATSPHAGNFWETASDPFAHSYSGIHSLSRGSPHESSGVAGATIAGTGPVPAMAPLFSTNSIWGPEQPREASGAATTAAADGETAAGLPHTGTTPTAEEKKKADASAAVAAEKREALKSMLPWSLQPAAEWASTDDVAGATPHYLLRGTEMLDVDEDEEEANTHRLKLDLHTGASMNTTSAVAAAAAAVRLTTEQLLTPTSAPQQAVPGGATTKPASDCTSQRSPAEMAEGTHVPRTPAGGGSDRARNSLAASLNAASVASELHRPSPPAQGPPPPPMNAAFPLYVMDPSQPGSPQGYPIPVPQQPQGQSGSQTPPAVLAHPSAPPPNQLLYYTVANGVPMLVQPPTTPGGVAMAFPLSGPVASGDPHMQQPYTAPGGMPYAGMMGGAAGVAQRGVPQRTSTPPTGSSPHSRAAVATSPHGSKPTF